MMDDEEDSCVVVQYTDRLVTEQFWFMMLSRLSL